MPPLCQPYFLLLFDAACLCVQLSKGAPGLAYGRHEASQRAMYMPVLEPVSVLMHAYITAGARLHCSKEHIHRMSGDGQVIVFAEKTVEYEPCRLIDTSEKRFSRMVKQMAPGTGL
uniref:Putative secreted protein n=1 Tax=Amblyomma americanum TaxID=6943 RepID=A0A0C9SD93_AMBAM